MSLSQADLGLDPSATIYYLCELCKSSLNSQIYKSEIVPAVQKCEDEGEIEMVYVRCFQTIC